ncbi:MAG: hypothetical protein ACLSIL_17600 [Enterococcus casseliflavus]
MTYVYTKEQRMQQLISSDNREKNSMRKLLFRKKALLHKRLPQTDRAGDVVPVCSWFVLYRHGKLALFQKAKIVIK